MYIVKIDRSSIRRNPECGKELILRGNTLGYARCEWFKSDVEDQDRASSKLIGQGAVYIKT